MPSEEVRKAPHRGRAAWALWGAAIAVLLLPILVIRQAREMGWTGTDLPLGTVVIGDRILDLTWLPWACVTAAALLGMVRLAQWIWALGHETPDARGTWTRVWHGIVYHGVPLMLALCALFYGLLTMPLFDEESLLIPGTSTSGCRLMVHGSSGFDGDSRYDVYLIPADRVAVPHPTGITWSAADSFARIDPAWVGALWEDDSALVKHPAPDRGTATTAVRCR